MSLNKLKPVSMLVTFSASTLLVLNRVLLNVSRLKTRNRNMCLFSADKMKYVFPNHQRTRNNLCWKVYRLINIHDILL